VGTFPDVISCFRFQLFCLGSFWGHDPERSVLPLTWRVTFTTAGAVPCFAVMNVNRTKRVILLLWWQLWDIMCRWNSTCLSWQTAMLKWRTQHACVSMNWVRRYTAQHACNLWLMNVMFNILCQSSFKCRLNLQFSLRFEYLFIYCSKQNIILCAWL